MVAEPDELQHLREQVLDRLQSRLARRQRLRREATVEAAIGFAGGISGALALALRAHDQVASVVIAVCALIACVLGAFDARRIRTLDRQIRSLAHVAASLG